MRFEQRKREESDLKTWLASLGALLLIGLVVACLHYTGVRFCVFHRLTGLPCFTCGATRATLLLLRGKLWAAIKIQPLVSVALVFSLCYTGIKSYLLWCKGVVVRCKLEKQEVRLAVLLLLVAMVVNWIWLLYQKV